MIVSNNNWQNCSVLKIADGGDPVEALVAKIRSAVFKAVEEGFSGPPFDPFDLAAHLGLSLSPRADIRDAKVVPLNTGGFKIEFNPNMAKARVKFSIAHEIAHTFFPDCDDNVRQRLPKNDMVGDDWELEMLCNIGAAEMLMPIGSFPALKDETLTIENLLRLRREFEVSMEAILLRIVRLTDTPCFAFAASKDESLNGEGRYYIDYSAASASFPQVVPNRVPLPKNSAVADCVAIGFEATGYESWGVGLDEYEVQCVGIPPYPGKKYPRVVGIARLSDGEAWKQTRNIKYVRGDASMPRGEGNKIIAHIVNDKAKRWGGCGFANAVSKKWPDVYHDFMMWRMENGANFSLGKSRLYCREEDICTFTMIAQHGYGKSTKPLIRYHAIEQCLQTLSQTANDLSASVHMPRIGCGHGGGDWGIISEMIDAILIQRGIEVTVYDLPR